MSDRQTLKDSKRPDDGAESNNGETVKSYYYDDSTGYETFDDETDMDDEDGSEGESRQAES